MDFAVLIVVEMAPIIESIETDIDRGSILAYRGG